MNALTDLQYISFAHPVFFGLLLLVPFMIWWVLQDRKKDSPSMRLTAIPLPLLKVRRSWKVRFRPVLFVLRLICVICLAIALARPQSSNVTESIDSEGIDIVLSLDVSGSMLAEDLKPNRLEAAKQVAMEFISQRPADRIGLVIFSGESFSQVPITIDHSVLKEQLSQIKSGMLVDGTAIGMGLATGVDRLRNAKGKSRILILLTDGVNNTGLVDPSTALEIAKAYKVRVYTIGVGTRDDAPLIVQTPMGLQTLTAQIDEDLLRKIAGETGGKYFRATSNRSLASIYAEIDKLEKTKIEMTAYKQYAELFFPFALGAIICLALEVLLRYTVFRSIT